MRKYIYWLLPVIIFPLLLSGCTKPVANQIKLGEEFTLSPGENEAISGENLDIKFVKVASDSRCPQGVTCIWAGEVSCLIEVTRANPSSTTEVVLTEPGPAKTFDGHQIAFRVEPYPVAGKTIAASDYKLLLTVTKSQ